MPYTLSDIRTEYFRCIPVDLSTDDVDDIRDTIDDLKESKKGVNYSKTTLLSEMQRRNLIGFRYNDQRVLLETPYYYPAQKVRQLKDNELVSEYVRTSEIVKVIETLIEQAYALESKIDRGY